MRRLIGIFLPIFALTIAQLACVQDCIGVSFKVVGRVVNSVGSPIAGASVAAYNKGSYGMRPFVATVLSDANGYFETDSVSSFACTPFEVHVSAVGYTSYRTMYYPPGEEWPHELPDEITVTLKYVSQ
jgi:hypothetical protein